MTGRNIAANNGECGFSLSGGCSVPEANDFLGRGSCLCLVGGLMNLLVVGKPGSGKTSWCRYYTDWLHGRGLSVGGILCPEVREHGERAGYNAVDLGTGEEVPFARCSGVVAWPKGEVIGRYTISRDGILFARRAIEQAVEKQCDLVVIDEVGPVELRGGGLMPAVELALATAVNVLIIIRSSLREALYRHFPNYQFRVIADFTCSPPQIPPPAEWGDYLHLSRGEESPPPPAG